MVNLEHDLETIDELRKEIGVLSHCDSPNIIRYHGSYLVGTKLWIVMDFCGLGSLRQLIDSIGPLDEASVLYIAREMVMALVYLHSNNIIHRDIKAANILLTEQGRVKLGDFGVASQVLNSLRRNSLVGSPYWMAPEVIKRSQYDSKADIWSLGIALYELLKGNPPLANVEPARAIFIIPKNAPPRLDSSFSPAIRELIAACLHDDPQKRPSAEDLLRHKAIRASKKYAGPPFIAVVEQYKTMRLAQQRDDAKSTAPYSEDVATMKSGWTFGTFRSEDYRDDSDQEPSRLHHSASRSISPAVSITPREFDDSIDDDQVEKESPSKLFANSVLRRSVSSLSLGSSNDGLSDKIISQTNSTQASHPKLSHTKQLSLLSFTLENTADAEEEYHQTYLKTLRLREKAQLNAALQLYECKRPPGLAEVDPIKIYKLMTQLKQALLEIPTPSDPRASLEDVQTKIEQHREFAGKYLALLGEAVADIGDKEC